MNTSSQPRAAHTPPGGRRRSLISSANSMLAGPLAGLSLPLCLAAAAALQVCAALIHVAVRPLMSGREKPRRGRRLLAR